MFLPYKLTIPNNFKLIRRKFRPARIKMYLTNHYKFLLVNNNMEFE